MPYALRIKFAFGTPEAPRTLAANRGAFAFSGRSATLYRYVPAVVNDEWTKINAFDVYGDVRSGPSVNQGWWSGCIHPDTGEWFIANSGSGAGLGTFWFNPNTGVWRKQNTNTTDWWKNQGFRENYDVTYDADRGAMWVATGGPVRDALGRLNAESAVFGVLRYDIAADTWTNVYPDATCTFSPSGAESTYFLTANKGLGPKGFDSKFVYYDGYLYKFGNYSVGADQNFLRTDPSTNVTSTLRSYPSLPPWSNQPARSSTYQRSGFDTVSKRFWTLADECELYVYDLLDNSSPAWVRLATTGTKPSTTAPAGYTGTDFGLVAELDEAANQLVVWCGSAGTVLADSGASTRKTWILDWTTLVWRDGPSAATGHNVPVAAPAVCQVLRYSQASRRVEMALGLPGTYTTQVWALAVGQSQPGKLTSFKLPSTSGSTYGTNYYGFPFTDTIGCKHVNMAYCPTDGRLYATGGDSISSATDGIWSLDPDAGTWRLDFGRPSYPNSAAPFAYQDNEGFGWDANRGKLIFWPGSGAFGYSQTNAPYAEGLWWFDPVAKTWQQDTTMFYGYSVTTSGTSTTVASNGSYASTGMLHGGIYDSQTDTIYASTSTAGMSRYHVGTMTRLGTATFVGYPGTAHPGYTGVYWREGKWEQVGRWIYMPTCCYNGVTGKWALAKWNIDNGAFVWCANPPMSDVTGTATFKEQRIGSSRNKIIWPKTVGPDGVIYGIYVYDIASDTWEVDTQVPGYGLFKCNSVASLPDGRVAMAGANTNGAQSHIWFYEAF